MTMHTKQSVLVRKCHSIGSLLATQLLYSIVQKGTKQMQNKPMETTKIILNSNSTRVASSAYFLERNLIDFFSVQEFGLTT